MHFVSVVDSANDSEIHLKVLASDSSFAQGPLMWGWTNSIRVGVGVRQNAGDGTIITASIFGGFHWTDC